MNNRLAKTLAVIDEANMHDPNKIDVGGQKLPAEHVYGSRMSQMLQEYVSDPSTHLQIAARGQHIERWKTPRADYPEGKQGYYQWRNHLKKYHAERVSEIMAQSGYDEEDRGRVSDLIIKKGLAHDMEVQKLEDVIVLVFLKYYAADFLAKHTPEKGIDVMAKTAKKMSASGVVKAGVMQMPEKVKKVLEEALKRI